MYILVVLFHTSQTQKNYDFLTIYDGANDYSNQIKKLSGNVRQFGISSNGNAMFLKFVTDSYDIYNGFLATFYYGNSTILTVITSAL